MIKNSETGNPFVDYYSVLKGGYGSAEKLRAIVLNLFNGQGYPLETELSTFLRNCDTDHAQAFCEIIQHYVEHGENCREFMRVAYELADERMASEAFQAGYSDATERGRKRPANEVPHGMDSEYREGYVRGEKDLRFE